MNSAVRQASTVAVGGYPAHAANSYQANIGDRLFQRNASLKIAMVILMQNENCKMQKPKC